MTEKLTENKPWYQSKTIIGALVAVAASIAGATLDVNLGAETQSQVTDALLAIVGAVGGAVAVYGRIKADTKVGK